MQAFCIGLRQNGSLVALVTDAKHPAGIGGGLTFHEAMPEVNFLLSSSTAACFAFGSCYCTSIHVVTSPFSDRCWGVPEVQFRFTQTFVGGTPAHEAPLTETLNSKEIRERYRVGSSSHMFSIIFSSNAPVILLRCAESFNYISKDSRNKSQMLSFFTSTSSTNARVHCMRET